MKENENNLESLLTMTAIGFIIKPINSIDSGRVTEAFDP
jgi:hypothetical protein